jgi:hypothetical protein
VAARSGQKLRELADTLLAIRQEIDSTLDAMLHRANQPIVASGEQYPQASRGVIEQTPLMLTDGKLDDAIDKLGVIGCVLGLRSGPA